MRTSFCAFVTALSFCLSFVPTVLRAETMTPTLFDYLKNGTAKQEFFYMEKSDGKRKLPCGKIFINSIACRGAADAYSADGRPLMPESLGAELTFDGNSFAHVPLTRTGTIALETKMVGFHGMHSFANPIFFDTTGTKCENRTASKASLLLETMIDDSYHSFVQCTVSYYRM
jgi:hypothetical protein